MQIVPPSQKSPTPTTTVRIKAVVSTAIAVAWVFASLAAAAYDLSPQFQAWHTLKVFIWVIQSVLIVTAFAFWMFERPRQVKVEGLAEPPVIHSS